MDCRRALSQKCQVTCDVNVVSSLLRWPTILLANEFLGSQTQFRNVYKSFSTDHWRHVTRSSMKMRQHSLLVLPLASSDMMTDVIRCHCPRPVFLSDIRYHRMFGDDSTDEWRSHAPIPQISILSLITVGFVIYTVCLRCLLKYTVKQYYYLNRPTCSYCTHVFRLVCVHVVDVFCVTSQCIQRYGE